MIRSRQECYSFEEQTRCPFYPLTAVAVSRDATSIGAKTSVIFPFERRLLVVSIQDLSACLNEGFRAVKRFDL
ncbi:hypothetical protein [Kaistella carnis]|uniref:Uncharacterized protein n=1 Tax=Kaistella carnis TaxID=1241979 RepID=A0A3G8XXZ2_9FLAO|nr:hypothetical protein [Kaistella carnis]AZI33611.1 hypothetical protein EIB73_10635 [Kaistella carnis]